MYAVYVLAAILLSVAPMHARTVLSALPAYAPGHRTEPARAARSPRAMYAVDRHASQAVAQRLLSKAIPLQPKTYSFLAEVVAPGVATDLLAHGPNAP